MNIKTTQLEDDGLIHIGLSTKHCQGGRADCGDWDRVTCPNCLMSAPVPPPREVTVKINGVSIITRYDKHGTQRLPSNRYLSTLVDKGIINLDDLCIKAEADDTARTAQARRWLYQNIGYSVCGYSEVFPEDDIDNPSWD